MKTFSVKSQSFIWDVKNEQVVDNDLIYEQFISKFNPVDERVLKNYRVESYRLNDDFTLEHFYEINKNNIVIFYISEDSIFHTDEFGNRSIRVITLPSKT